MRTCILDLVEYWGSSGAVFCQAICWIAPRPARSSSFTNTTMKHLIPSIFLAFLTLLSACGGGSTDSGSSDPYDGVPESLQELIGDVSLSWSYTENGTQMHQAFQFSYTRDDVFGNNQIGYQLEKRITLRNTLACIGASDFVITGPKPADYTCTLSPTSRPSTSFGDDVIELWLMQETDSTREFTGEITTADGTKAQVSMVVTAPKS